MFIIAGKKGEVTAVGKGKFYCPQCDKRLDYIHYQVHEKATVFFIPVANLKLLGEYIECQQCHGTFKKDVLKYNPEYDMQKFKAIYFQGMLRVLVMMMLADGKIEKIEKKILKDVFASFTGNEIELTGEVSSIHSCSQNTPSQHKNRT